MRWPCICTTAIQTGLYALAPLLAQRVQPAVFAWVAGNRGLSLSLSFSRGFETKRHLQSHCTYFDETQARGFGGKFPLRLGEPLFAIVNAVSRGIRVDVSRTHVILYHHFALTMPFLLELVAATPCLIGWLHLSGIMRLGQIEAKYSKRPKDRASSARRCGLLCVRSADACAIVSQAKQSHWICSLIR